MQSSWTAIAYRSNKTGSSWRVFGKTLDEGQAIIDSFMRKEKLGLIWLAHRRVGGPGSNHFELVFKQRRQVLRGVSKQPALGTRENIPQDGRDQLLAREGSKRRLH